MTCEKCGMDHEASNIVEGPDGMCAITIPLNAREWDAMTPEDQSEYINKHLNYPPCPGGSDEPVS